MYNASLAAALARLGHEVHLMCQERAAGELPWVDRVGTWRDGNLQVEPAPGEKRPPGKGSVTAYIPDIGGLLPVYVRDAYEGFEVKTFAELDDAELHTYIDANVAAARDVVEAAGGVDAALANHLVMGPLILARAGVRFAAKIHGSALEFTVRPNPRFLSYAAEGAEAAAAILVGSRHTAESLWGTLPDIGLQAKTRLGPPGVDTQRFSPKPPDEAVSAVRALAADVGGNDRAGEWGEDSAAAAAALERWADAPGPRVAFVGKLIGSKGIDLLLAAWPLVVRAHPGARLLVVAFGEGRPTIDALCAALDAGDLSACREIAEAGMVTVGADAVPLSMLESFLASAPESYPDAARVAAGSVALAGSLEHDEVARTLPAADALVFPSTFPEAFGMVAAEAAACGVLPVSADHSGAREVTRALAPALPEAARELLAFPLGDGAVEAIADRLDRWLALDPAIRGRTREALAARSRELWSWERVADGVLAACAGRLDQLRPVPQ